MNKQRFLNALKHKLRQLKKAERNKYIEYYDEIISDIIETGVPEEEAVAKQGSIEQIVADIIADVSPASLKTKDWRGICLVAASVVLLLSTAISLIFKIQAKMSMSAAVGIIGGADGPTSIFVAGKIGTPWGLYIATAAVVVGTVVYFVKRDGKH